MGKKKQPSPTGGLNDYQKLWLELIAHAWLNDTFRNDLVNKSTEVLTDVFEKKGLKLPEGIEFKVHDGTETPKMHHLFLPPRPDNGKLTQTDLRHAREGDESALSRVFALLFLTK